MVDTHPKLATISDIFLVFNKIALNLVDFPLPPFNVEYAIFSSRFCGRDNIEMEDRGKENKDVLEWNFFEIVSQPFLHGIEDPDSTRKRGSKICVKYSGKFYCGEIVADNGK